MKLEYKISNLRATLMVEFLNKVSKKYIITILLNN